jgi:hypothetical protein
MRYLNVVFSLSFLFSVSADPLPKYPSRNMNTVVIQKNDDGILEPTSNHLPILDMTRDGRIGIKRSDGYRTYIEGSARGGAPLYLLKPEKVKAHFKHPQNELMGGGLMDEEGFRYRPGRHISLANRKKVNAVINSKNVMLSPHRTIVCEKFEERENPYVCDGNKDCYKVTLVTRFQKDLSTKIADVNYKKIRLAAIDATIKVSNPKTASARISSVTFDQSSFKVGPVLTFPKLAEPVIAGDNRLLVTRVHRGKRFTLGGRRDGVTKIFNAKEDDINIVYSAYSEDEAQCDVTKWNNFKPISYAYADTYNNMKDRYKFARYPLRDSLGQTVEPGRELGGSYPWMDKDAVNLFYTAFGADHFYNFVSGNVVSPFQEKDDGDYVSPYDFSYKGFRAFAAEANLYEVRGSETVGITMAGFWTHGKSVLLDGQLNNTDYAFTIADRVRADGTRVKVNRKLELYSATPAGKAYEDVGAMRELGDTPLIIREYHKDLTPNSTFMGSVENRLNYHTGMKPVTPRDVVWLFGSTRYTEEVAFDDYMNPFMVINAEMTAPVGYELGHRMKHYDGFERSVAQSNDFSGFPQVPLSTPALIQNASTAPPEFLTPPHYGKLHGNARIEPIAKGGIHGKGLWLDSNSGVTFSIPSQTSTAVDAKFDITTNKNWYMSLFLDARDKTSASDLRNLVSWNSRSIALRKVREGAYLFDRLVFREGTKVIGYFHLPDGLKIKNKRWRNIGVSFNGNSGPYIYIDGMYAGAARPSKAEYKTRLAQIFSLDSGSQIVVGQRSGISTAGVNGWIDDFKLIARNPTLEERCNYSRGTLAQIDPAQNSYWLGVANSYPMGTHRTISKIIGKPESSPDKYVCFTRYYGGAKVGDELNSDYHANLKNMPTGFVSVREDVLKIKNKLVYNQPRPSFTKNHFCLSCHVSDDLNPNNELNLTALERHGHLAMQHDTRRQPMQSASVLRGVIPANYFGKGKPARAITSNTESFVDQWLHPVINNLNVSWNKGTTHTYSFDIRYLDEENDVKTIAPCVHSGILKTKNSLIFNGACYNGKKPNLNSETKIRICSAKDNSWRDKSKVNCTPYLPLSLRKGNQMILNLKHK